MAACQLLIKDTFEISKIELQNANEVAIAQVLNVSPNKIELRGAINSRILKYNIDMIDNQLIRNNVNIHFSFKLKVIPEVRTIVEGSPYNAGLLHVRNLIPINRFAEIGFLPFFGRKQSLN